MRTADQLRRTLTRINGKGYKAYKDIQGDYDIGSFSLHVDHVQGDPFAAPSKLRVRVPMPRAGFPSELHENKVRTIALEDFVARQVQKAIAGVTPKGRGSGKSGLMTIDAGRQEVLERTACRITSHWVEARIYAGLPAAGRRVLGREAEGMLLDQLPQVVQKGLHWRHYPREKAVEFVESVENQEYIRSRLPELDILAFVADGSVLPRESGYSQKPLPLDNAVLFKTPEAFRITIDLPNPVSRKVTSSTNRITGMGIPRGLTLIVGGGYHGKSTLLQALERGVYPHIPGDGREYVVASGDTVKIRAEDGRRVEKVDISPFISNLPLGVNTRKFSTDNASGSTSQATNIIEALEIGAKTLLLDEDTSATNFMVRDVRMQELVHKEFEPITPFIERVREIYNNLGVSTILVMGGCGDYFDVADTVIMMKDYLPQDMTEAAAQLAEVHTTGRRQEASPCNRWQLDRAPLPETFDPSRGKKPVKIDAKGQDQILYGRDLIDLRGIEQLVNFSQTRAVGLAIHLAATRFMDGKTPLKVVLEKLDGYLEEKGLDPLDPFHRSEYHPGSFARPRRYEIAAAINRLRAVHMTQI